MKRVLMLLIVLMISLVISGCPKPIPVEPVITIKTVYVFNECPVPAAPTYLKMDNTSHLGSAFNINILVGNAMKMKSYNTGLISTIDCYEKQSKEYNDEQN